MKEISGSRLRGGLGSGSGRMSLDDVVDARIAAALGPVLRRVAALEAENLALRRDLGW